MVTGSHLDTVPRGGRYDGALGVLAGLEAVRILRAHGFAAAPPALGRLLQRRGGLAASDEHARLTAFCGTLDLDDLAAARRARGDGRGGLRVRASRARRGGPTRSAPSSSCTSSRARSSSRRASISGSSTARDRPARLPGDLPRPANHAGTTPMDVPPRRARRGGRSRARAPGGRRVAPGHHRERRPDPGRARRVERRSRPRGDLDRRPLVRRRRVRPARAPGTGHAGAGGGRGRPPAGARGDASQAARSRSTPRSRPLSSAAADAEGATPPCASRAARGTTR